MVATRACAPSDGLYRNRRWIREDVRIEGARGRPMDLFEKHEEELKKAVHFRLRPVERGRG